METVVSFAVERLGELLIQEAKFLRGVADKVEKIKTELKQIQCALKDADTGQDESEIFRNWVKEIREAAYDAEDVIETFASDVAMKTRRGGDRNTLKRYACIFSRLNLLHKVGTEIDATKKRISNLNAGLQTYTSNRSVGEGERNGSRKQVPRRTYSHVVDEDTVGVEESVKTLVEHLVSSSSGVVSICGMGGLGKTTLAKKVYRHDDVRRHFNRFAWCSISQQFNIRTVLQGILTNLKSLSKEEKEGIEKMSEADLFREVSEIQLREKCLVILDDVWRGEDMTTLGPAFPLRNGVSKIMITTRKQEVAGFYANQGGFLYEPKLLTEEESWELLRSKAFPTTAHGKDLTINKDMEELGKRMAKRCDGLPLAIVLLGGILAMRASTLYEWESVDRNLKLHLEGQGSYNQQGQGVFNVLGLSYQDLPYHLKPCFLYLSSFPEDYEIRASSLVQMWMAEGIIPSNSYEGMGEKILEDVGEQYLNELIRRCVVQVEAKSWNGRVKTCRLHDLMRDLCLLKAKEENFVQIITPPQVEANSSSMATTTANKVRRCVIHLDEGAPFDDLYDVGILCQRFLDYSNENGDKHGSFHLVNAAHVRSLLIFLSAPNQLHWMTEKLDFKDFKLLRVLNLEGLVLEEKSLRTIANLIHLKFLSFKQGLLHCFPSFLGDLRCIQTLDLRMYTGGMIPRSAIHDLLRDMKWLRYLCLPDKISGDDTKVQWDYSRNLEILKNFDASVWDVTDLAKLTKLRKLSIASINSFKELEKILNPSCPISNDLHSLALHEVSTQIEEGDLMLLSACQHLYKLHLYAEISNLPSHNPFPLTLAKLTLAGCRLEQDPMPILERLPNLSILRLICVAYFGEEMVLSTNGFPQLILMQIEDAHNLKRVRVDKGAMPRLKTLKIGCCLELEMIPEGLRYITTLKELEFYGVYQKFCRRLQVIDGEEGEDFYKVKHVPSISFKFVREKNEEEEEEDVEEDKDFDEEHDPPGI